ncbi:hypothetical protein [Flavobacterium granuli]|uniref:Uncharacterized protein n=1 Tax=Flavobacterium granuli TaxID=280093 RepID=A0A1M5LC86_9FLAO|nr:hypothetical protein [Flavobacterium granuli]PRZ23930.1 hypothetical protein BC624_10439 [Flavobacterium granuli]SHG62586.1 hypothetical protein SAMN05443373_10339 [Flavobacterium granuli]
MKLYRLHKILLTLLLAIFFSSCSSDLDFNQVNNLKIEPVVVANLSYFDLPANAFVENGIESDVAFQALDFDLFRDKYFRSYLQRADFSFEMTNTINRAFRLNIILFNQNDQPLYTIPFSVPAYAGNAVVVSKTDIFEGVKLDLLKSSKKMGFLIVMASGPVLNENSVGSLKMRSSATVYLTIE